ncbi:MAG: hypothetical protein H7175_12785, partial [Burkholderiales bacterium]|nr:hypothetical protein [Anaerolineae bacterium]
LFFGTGRLIWLQFRFEDEEQYYWAGSWNFNVDAGSQPIPDAAAINPFGRLVAQMTFGFSQTNNAYYGISGIWRSIATGGSATCNFVPELIEPVTFTAIDLEREPAFVPAVRALQSATDSVNHAIALFAEACAAIGAERIVTADIVGTALDDVDSAEVNLVLIQALLPELINYDPSLNPDPLAAQLSADVPGISVELPQPPARPTIDLPIVPPPTNTPSDMLLPTLSVTIEPTSIPPSSTPMPTMPPLTTPTG